MSKSLDITLSGTQMNLLHWKKYRGSMYLVQFSASDGKPVYLLNIKKVTTKQEYKKFIKWTKQEGTEDLTLEETKQGMEPQIQQQPSIPQQQQQPPTSQQQQSCQKVTKKRGTEKSLERGEVVIIDSDGENTSGVGEGEVERESSSCMYMVDWGDGNKKDGVKEDEKGKVKGINTKKKENKKKRGEKDNFTQKDIKSKGKGGNRVKDDRRKERVWDVMTRGEESKDGSDEVSKDEQDVSKSSDGHDESSYDLDSSDTGWCDSYHHSHVSDDNNHHCYNHHYQHHSHDHEGMKHKRDYQKLGKMDLCGGREDLKRGKRKRDSENHEDNLIHRRKKKTIREPQKERGPWGHHTRHSKCVLFRGY
eukprot:TRINITY_DN10222_c0_g4_i1.p1 TRINITY_DN10222_c0_g4~~TRINITY_DN10222_c0_g4_i1.p1  ORF type:complete len:362 (-),score=105.80 TRINITY_DN10222_c0_g4_i1:155-1240(-)